MAIQRPGTRRFGLLAICVLTLLIIWHNQHLHNSISEASKPISKSNPTPNTQPPTSHASSIISSSLKPPGTSATDIDLSSARAPFISWPLRRLCSEQTSASTNATIPGLVFLCDNNSGGPGNIRNYVLTCVRYAIAAGATGLQVPRIRTRAAANKADLFREYRPLGYMFSESHFRAALADACPHIQLFPTKDEARNGDGDGDATGDLTAIPGVAAKAARERIAPDRMVRRVTPKHFGGSRAGCDVRDPNRHTDRFGEAFREWMGSHLAEFDLPPTSWEEPFLVRLSWGVLWDWPVLRDGPELAASFGGLLRIREDLLEITDSVVSAVRELAAAAAAASSAAKIEGRKDEDEPSLGGNHHHQRFLGIHLRTEEDALSQWPTYENQSKGYLSEAETQGFRGGVAYLASGSESETRRFGEDARAQLGLQVKSKYDLLQGQELERLKSLTWDQQALVDFAVLLESDYFVGVSPSSFSINVALKRHLQQEGLYTRPWKVGAGDERSWLVGRYFSYWDDWLFMFDGMWA